MALRILACCRFAVLYHGSMRFLSFHAFGPFFANQLLVLLFCTSLILSSAFALEVVPGSNCTAACTRHFLRINTTGDDISCYDQDYNSSVAGTAFKDCVTCELESLTLDHQTNQTDLGWALCTSDSETYEYQLVF